MSRILAGLTVVVLLLSFPAFVYADAVSDWNTIMVTVILPQNPFAQARLAAITQLAVFEAVNACTGTYKPYLGTITAPSDSSPDAAASVAAHDVLKFYFPASAVALDAALANSLAAIPNGPSKDHGIAVGQAAAAEMIALRTNDGSAPPQTFLPSSSDPGVWQPTPPAFSPGILYHWRNVNPFGIRSSQQFRSAAPPALTSREYTQSYLEVLAVGDVNSTQRPTDRADVARYFNVASAPHVWNSVVQQLSAAQGSSISEKARAFALVNMAISDGLVSSMETKYYYVRWRPVTAIRAGATDDNPDTDADPSYTPFITTPAFPSYPSAHASGSYAARVVAERIFGCKNVSITLSHPGIPSVVLHYADLKTITDDIDDARVYGGIHFRYDQQAGARQGRSVGSFVFSHNLNAVDSNSEDSGEIDDCK
jgi:PAP2 superfamily